MYFQKLFCLLLLTTGSFFLFESCTEKEPMVIDEVKQPTEFVSPLWQLLSSEIFKDTDRKFCFELEFPIKLQLSDESAKSLNSYEELISFVEIWYTENAKNFKNEPTINYPVKATLKDETASELKDDMAFLIIIENCLDDVHLDFFKMLPSRCYQIDYPITIIEKDDTQIEFDSYEAVFESLFTTKSRPVNIEFPFSISINGEQIVINSEVDIEESIEACENFLTAQPQNNDILYCGFIDSEILRWIQYQNDYQFLEECFNISYPVTILSGATDELKINNNQEFTNILQSILANVHNGGQDSIDFNYPIEVRLLEEDRTVSLNSGDEFIKIFDHCQ